jgi:RNA polymerase sigma-70 factor (ECF subfamily)
MRQTGKQPRTSGPAPSPDGRRDLVTFDRLYRENVDRVYRFAQRMCGPGEDPQDLVQETFLKAYRALGRFRGEAQASTWLYTIAARAFMRMRRRRTGQPEHELSLDEFIPAAGGELKLQIPAKDLSPEEALLKKEVGLALHKAIHALPPKYRAVLVLRDMEGLSAKETGAVMGLNERAVKSRLHRARLFIRKQLSQNELQPAGGRRR